MTGIVQFQHVSKKHRIGQRTSIRDAVSHLPFLRKGKSPSENDILWAVKDLSFEVEKGKVLGFIGPNGAGKTSTLKLLSGITKPTEGTISVSGRISSLIELGAGFHPDLTGRENVYLNGAILGLSKKEIDQRYNAIVAFAELERFMEMPVKRYSSGMYARLGFAVAAHTDPDLLLVDEVLAVGDVSFQRKCYNFINDFVTSGKTAVFVSHSMYVIEQLCSRIIWLDAGHKMMEGDPGKVLVAYLDKMEERRMLYDPVDFHNQGKFHITGIYFHTEAADDNAPIRSGENLTIEIRYRADKEIHHPHFVLALNESQDNRPLFLASMLADGSSPEVIHGVGSIFLHLKELPLMPRVYYIFMEVFDNDRIHMLFEWQKISAFKVDYPNQITLQAGAIRHTRADAPLRIPYSWDFSAQPETSLE